ncbi:hypothetical protein [Actinoplanes sp. URMC 104]|uniref:hypothetical protein n=1 Tax=Actinoplanes sp. URMC 104 TaxID=3423409 RepID=UPI003F1A0226
MKIRNQRTVAVHLINNRKVNVQRIAWHGTDGLSFDLYDDATGTCFTPESLDHEPSRERVEEIIKQLAADHRAGTLDVFYEGSEKELAVALGIIQSTVVSPGSIMDAQQRPPHASLSLITSSDNLEGATAAMVIAALQFAAEYDVAPYEAVVYAHTNHGIDRLRGMLDRYVPASDELVFADGHTVPLGNVVSIHLS